VKILDLFGFTLAASAGACVAAVALSPAAASAPLPKGGPTCVEQMSGLAGPVAAGAPVPMALPGPLPAAGGAPVVPGAPVLPAAPMVPAAPVPAGAPAGAAAPAAAPMVADGAPLLQMAGAGKGARTDPGPGLTAFPVILPGPPPPPPAPAPVTEATLTSATAPMSSHCMH
jgi:hypothetical protein